MAGWDRLYAKRAERMRASEIRELLKLLERPDVISFAGGVPDPALFPAEAFERACTEVLARGASALQYSVSEGYPPLRAWIAAQMTALGIPCGIENIVVTSGSQQALDYLGRLFLSAGDTALVGWPTYLGALQAFNAYEPRYDRLLPAQGNMTPAAYREAARHAGGEAKLAYLTPDFANPTGETLDRAARERLLDLADELDVAVIEDGAYQALRYDGEAVPPLLALDIQRQGAIDNCRTIYCGSFSKTLAPGLRVGWVCAARPVIEKLVMMKQAADLHSPTMNQMVMHRVAEEAYAEQVEKVRAAYRRRRDLMLEALARHMPAGVTWTRPEGGMFVWVTLPPVLDATALLARAIERAGVAFVPGQAFHADGSGSNTFRLSYSLAEEGSVAGGIERLAGVIAEALAETSSSAAA